MWDTLYVCTPWSQPELSQITLGFWWSLLPTRICNTGVLGTWCSFYSWGISKTTNVEHGQNLGRTSCSFHGNSMNNLLSYCGLIDAKIKASDKNLPVHVASIELFIFRKAGWDLISLSKGLVYWTTCTQRVIRRELKTDSYSKGPTLFGLRCILCHNFWTNYDLDLFSTSKWPSDLQFCERYKGRCQKND